MPSSPGLGHHAFHVKTPYSFTTWVFAAGNALIAVFALLLALRGFGHDSWPLRVSSLCVAVLLSWSAFGLARATRWRLAALRACALLELTLGLCAIATLAVAAYHLGAAAAVEGPFRPSGTLTLTLGLALLLPYLLVYPAVQLLWLRRERQHTAP